MIDAVTEFRARSYAPIGGGIELCQLELIANNKQDVVNPQPLESFVGHNAGTRRRVAQKYAAVLHSLDYDKMVIAMILDQSDRRNSGGQKLIDFSHKAIGLKTASLKISFHVQ